MRSDVAPGATFPDYELPDHTNVPRRLSELQGRLRPPMAGDIAQAATAGRVAELALDRFGRIDTLLNNAGVFIIRKSFTDCSRGRATPGWPSP